VAVNFGMCQWGDEVYLILARVAAANSFTLDRMAGLSQLIPFLYHLSAPVVAALYMLATMAKMLGQMVVHEQVLHSGWRCGSGR
jgi:hypothetical protein